MPHKKKRPIRIERSDSYHLEDSTENLWAVSYADVLMVLLSFFILFFSVSEDEKESVIYKITKSTDFMPSSKSTQKNQERTPDGLSSQSPKGLRPQIKDLIQSYNYKVDNEKDRFLILFSENLFSKGSMNLNLNTKNEIKKLVKELKPYWSQIELVFIGHSDNSPVKIKKTKIISNNFDLSALRASKALAFALQLGVSPQNVSARGSASSNRNSRTLSLLIKPK